MITRPIFTNASGVRALVWSAGGVGGFTLGNGLANITTVDLSTFDCDELGLLVTAANVANEPSVRMRVSWLADLDTTYNPTGRPCADTYVTLAQAAGVNTITPNINEWEWNGGNNVALTSAIALPVLAQFVRIGVYANGAPTNITLTIDVQPIRTEATQR